MAFNFGGGAPAPGAAPAAPAAPSAAFGAAPAAPATAVGFGAAAPATPAPAPGAFSFGGAAAAPTAPAAPSTPGAFAFGGNPAPETPALATGGGLFGASTPAPAATTTTLVAPVGGGSFGASVPTAAAPGQLGTPAPQTQAAVFIVPDFETVFPYMPMLSKIRALQEATSGDSSISDSPEAAYAGQELLQLLQTKTALSNPPAPVLTPPNQSLRQQLQANPNVQLNNRLAGLTPQMLKEVFGIADDLHLSENDALSLYAQVTQPATRQWLHDSLQDGTEDKKDLLNDITKAASALYFQQRRALLQSILLLSQCRLQRSLVEATDTLLQNRLIPNLATLITNLTKLATQVQQELDQQKQQLKQHIATYGQLQPQQKAASDKKKTATTTWLHHLYQERQVAAEALFYLTYSTQCTADEIAILVDLVCDLSKDAVSLDPVKDVPDAHYPIQQQQQQWASGPFTQALPPLREKDALLWESELVQQVWDQRQPYALQCTSVLVMAVICSLDTKQELLNRDTHQAQQGNELFQRGLDTSMAEIAPIHQRLHGDAVEKWGDRKDVWGVLAAAYALSLRPVSSVAASPRASAASTTTTMKKTWKACLTAPSEHKSFSFVRLSLMPAISFNPASNSKNAVCDLPEFLMSVLSDYVSSYLDVVCASNEVPLSRAKWQAREEERLVIQREEREREISFCQSYGTPYDSTKPPIPDHVDLMQRPDCMDSIVALAIAVCSQGPNYAHAFWSHEEHRTDNGSLETRPKPSRALQRLAMLQERDTTLIPTYVAFLAALAIAEPSAVFDLLNNDSSTNSEEGTAPSTNNALINWKSLFGTLRWYVRKMSDGYAGEAKPASTQETSGVPFSGYYYGADHYGSDGISTTTAGTSATHTAAKKLTELGETNQAIVMSHLAVITKVAANYATGRTLLATMNLPFEDGSPSSLVDQESGDSILVVLFSLAIAPLTPQLRGAVFATLASLLQLDGTNSEEQLLIRDLARKGWDLLELSQAVPVYWLDQYQSKRQQQPGTAPQVVQAMTFPPASIATAKNTGGAKSLLPAEPKYGIVFEMEHVESRLGYYPSTEGLLQLLTSLVIAAGCPSDLGQNKPERLRPGSTPYIEYVLYFVLPRALGSRRAEDPLPFKAGVDSSRLVARALEVIEAVLTRYSVPASPGSAAPLALLRLPELVNDIMLAPTGNDAKSSALDFYSKKNPVPNGSTKFPSTKSAGFTILADILSASESELLCGLGLVLTQDGGCHGVYTVSGQKDFRYRMAFAVYGDTAPSVATAKHKNDTVPTFQKQSLLQPLLPPIDVAGDVKDSNDSVHWRAKSIRASLRILAAAAAREEAFLKALSSRATVVPVLQFKAPINMVQKKEVHLTSVRDGLTHSTSPRCFPAVAQYLCSISSDDATDCAISGSALALLMYTFNGQSATNSLAALDAQSVAGELNFTRAVAERLEISSKRTERRADADIARVIIELLQSELSPLLLGFPHKSVDGLDAPGVVSMPHGPGQNESFTVLLSRLADDDFLTNPSSSGIAASCMEIIYNMIASCHNGQGGQHMAAHLESRLKTADFWNAGALKFLADRSSGASSLLDSTINASERPQGVENVLHTAAWFANGLAMHCARKVQVYSQDSLSRENQRLLGTLLDGDYRLLVNLVACLPLEDSCPDCPSSIGKVLHEVQACMHPMKGRPHAANYRLVNAGELKLKMGKHYKDDGLDSAVKESTMWARAYNDYVQWDCAAAHLSTAASNLMEASLEFSDWTIRSGISGILGNSNQLMVAREKSLLVLLDQLLDRLIGDTDKLKPMCNRLPISSSISLSNEVLLLTDRLLSSTRDRIYISHFIGQVSRATLSSLLTKGANLSVDEDERSIVLGTALSQLLATENVELHDESLELVCAVADSFAQLSYRSANIEAGDDTERRMALVSMASRSILSSFTRSLDPASPDGTNPIIANLATSLSSSSMSKTNLEALIQVVPTLDDNICQLLEMIASCQGGANLLVKAGIMRALSQAAHNYTSVRQKEGSSFGSGPPAFFEGNLTLVRVLLASDDLFKKERDSLQSGAQKLMVSYTSIIEEVARSFPSHGNTWLEIVQTLASAMWDTNGSVDHIVFGSAKIGQSHLSTGLGQLVGNVVCLVENLVEYPFPKRLQPMLPQGLRIQEPTQVWWDTVEQELVALASSDDTKLPSPPTGLDFGWSKPDDDDTNGKYGAWTDHKYERCYAGVQVADASLTFLIERARDESGVMFEFSVGSIARGMCRLTDSANAMTKRLTNIKAISEGSTMDTGAFDSHSKDSMLAERSFLDEISPLLQRTCEKLLVLGHAIFFRMKTANEASYHGLISTPSAKMREFAEVMSLSLQYTQLETEGFSEFSGTLAKKLRSELKSINK